MDIVGFAICMKKQLQVTGQQTSKPAKSENHNNRNSFSFSFIYISIHYIQSYEQQYQQVTKLQERKNYNRLLIQ